MPRIIEQVRAVPGEIKNLPRSIKRVSFLVFIYYLSWGVASPFLPLFFHDVLGTYGRTTFIGAIQFIFAIMWMFPLGELLNKVSHKKLMRLSLLFYIPLWPFLAFAQTFLHFLVYQFYHSIIATGFWSSAGTYTRLNSPRGKKSESWGLYDVGSVFSVIFGAIIGAVLLEWFFDIRTMFLVVPTIFVVAAFFYAGRLPEDYHRQGFMDRFRETNWKHVYFGEIKDFLSVPELRRLLPFIFSGGFLAFSLSYLLPLFAESVGASYMHIGLIMAFFAVPLLLEVPFSVLADIWSSRILVVLGFLMASLSLAGISFTDNILALFPLVIVLGIATSMVAPTISGKASNVMSKEKIGELNAVYSASFAFGGVVGLLSLGPVADAIGITAPFFVSALLMFACAVIAWFVWE